MQRVYVPTEGNALSMLDSETMHGVDSRSEDEEMSQHGEHLVLYD